MRTPVIVLFVALLLVGGVSAAAAQPLPPTLTGVWEGVITGSEMATASGIAAQKARLTIRDDRTWTIETATWQTSGTVQMRGGHLVLDGNFVSANPGTPSGMARYYLTPWGNGALGGSGSADFAGGHITTGVQLKKVQ